jgi:hypothetical protein
MNNFRLYPMHSSMKEARNQVTYAGNLASRNTTNPKTSFYLADFAV